MTKVISIIPNIYKYIPHYDYDVEEYPPELFNSEHSKPNYFMNFHVVVRTKRWLYNIKEKETWIVKILIKLTNEYMNGKIDLEGMEIALSVLYENILANLHEIQDPTEPLKDHKKKVREVNYAIRKINRVRKLIGLQPLPYIVLDDYNYVVRGDTNETLSS